MSTFDGIEIQNVESRNINIITSMGTLEPSVLRRCLAASYVPLRATGSASVPCGNDIYIVKENIVKENIVKEDDILLSYPVSLPIYSYSEESSVDFHGWKHQRVGVGAVFVL